MDAGDNEQVLSGGNINTVFKVGETVRRPVSKNSRTVHELLRHLESRGVPAPRFLGIDERGRETLTFIGGETGIPRRLWETDDALITSARLLRRFHDATPDFVPSEPASWAFIYPDAERREVICHNDFAPYNMVFRDNRPVAVLDFDLCGPGPRVRDLAYLAYWMVPLSFGSGDLLAYSERDASSGSPRLLRLCESYGGNDQKELLPMVSEVLHHMSDKTAATRMVGPAAASRLEAGGHFDHWAKEAKAFDERLDSLDFPVCD